MKETLQPFHFQKPERPKEEDYALGLGGTKGEYDYTAFQKALSEWESLYGDKPEPEWVSFDERAPDIEQECYRLQVDGQIFYYCRHNEHMSLNPSGSTHWVDKATYDTRLAEWKYHQVRYPGWKNVGGSIYMKGGWSVSFKEGFTWIRHLQLGVDVTMHAESFTTNLFDMIIKENGIEL